MPLSAPSRDCEKCAAASSPDGALSCASQAEVSAANPGSSGVDKPECLRRIEALVEGFSGQIKMTAKI